MKLKYIFYMAAALSLTGCNDSFLERSPQSLNDQSFWVSVNDLKTYANAFYGLIPGGAGRHRQRYPGAQQYQFFPLGTVCSTHRRRSMAKIKLAEHPEHQLLHDTLLKRAGCRGRHQHLCRRNALLPCLGIFQEDSAFG